MKGYPKTPFDLLTKQDYEHLAADPRFRERALADLQRLYDIDDEYVERVIELADPADPESVDVTERIKNPGTRATHRSGFKNHAEISAKLAEVWEKEKIIVIK